LLNSATPEFPNGLANSSGELGHNLMDHHMGAGASAVMPGHGRQSCRWQSPQWIYVPRFRNVKTKQKDFLRGYGYQGGGSREGWSRGVNNGRHRRRLQELAAQARQWHMSLGGLRPNACRTMKITSKSTKTSWTPGASHAKDSL